MGKLLALVPVEVRQDFEQLEPELQAQLLDIYAQHRDTKGKRRLEVTTPPDWGNSHRYRWARRRFGRA